VTEPPPPFLMRLLLRIKTDAVQITSRNYLKEVQAIVEALFPSDSIRLKLFHIIFRAWAGAGAPSPRQIFNAIWIRLRLNVASS
jgi:hypothetical protein